jgi:hypothetical protein
MIRRLALATLLLASTALPGHATDLPVRAVTLSSAGLAQIERGGPVPPEAPAASFRVPVEDVDDILRSLVVADPAGRLEGVRLPAQNLEAEAFRGLPVEPGDFESRARLLSALRGQRVAVDGTEGLLAEAAETPAGLRVSLVTPQGLRSLVLREAQEVRVLDTGLAARLARAAEALAEARAADTRQVTVALRPGATAPREITATYVAGAPLWKPSWRLVAPGFGETGATARLMGWAVVENRSGADWAGVRLSLVSGEAAALRQALYTPVILPRREVPVEGSGQVVVDADTGGRPVAEPMPAPAPAPGIGAPAPAEHLGGIRLAPGAQAMAAPLPPPAVSAPPPVAETMAEAVAGRVAFTLADPVTVRAGETANLPFLDVRLPADRMWWVQDLSAANPLQAVRLRNTTPHALPAGLVTLFGAAEAGGFLGDAELRLMPPGEQRLLAYARDREVLLNTTRRNEQTPLRADLRRGAVMIAYRNVHEVRMAVDSRGVRGLMVVDLPARRGETPRFTPVAEGDFGLRVEVSLDGERSTLSWQWERPSAQTITLWDAALPEPLPPAWRGVERELGRLPGGGTQLDALRNVLARLPADAPGRDALAVLVEEFAEARRLMDAFREAQRLYAAAEAALIRARRAVEDRTGAERERARSELNAASLRVDRAGAAADAAWIAWRSAAQRVVARGG